jgi:hypothetical protein
MFNSPTPAETYARALRYISLAVIALSALGMLAVVCCGAEPEPEPEPIIVCLTELWEEYDYSYPDGNDTYSEMVRWSWTVEVPTELANGMRGWTYVGMVCTARVVRHDIDKESVETAWATHTGKVGTEETTKDGIRRVLGEHFGTRIVGEIDILWR